MPRIHADNYHDCFIDCENGGFATYILEDGPCDRECYPASFAPRVGRLPIRDLLYLRLNGRIWNYPCRNLAPFASRLRLQGFPVAGAEIAMLEDLARAPLSLRATATWENSDVEGMLAILVEASVGRAQF